MKPIVLFAVPLLLLQSATAANPTIQDESQAPPCPLPEVLRDAQSRPLDTAVAWQAHRQELLKQFGGRMYGVTPLGRPGTLKFGIREELKEARGGRATRLRVGVLFEGTETGRQMELLVYLPNDVTAKAPVLLGLNFDGNYTTVTDPDLPVPTHYAHGLFDNTVMGFSRLGKAALWAGAQDERFAAVISNASGAGRLALIKRLSSEQVADLVKQFPHWFCRNFANYAGKKESLPFDQHHLAALIAPRPLLATSATEDSSSDPRGEYLTLKAVSPVYALLGKKGLDESSPPQPGKLISSPVGYFLREGGHDVTLEDWRAILAFAGKHLGLPSPPASALTRYYRRSALLPADPENAWEAWFLRSDSQRLRHDEQLAAEVEANGLTGPLRAPAGTTFKINPDKTVTDTTPSHDEATLTAHLISWQLTCGGWSKAVSYASPRLPGMAWTSGSEPNHYAGTLDNRSTTEQLRFLARRQTAFPDEKVKASAERGIDYLLEAQFPNGAWPQNYPLEGGYHDAITLNDDAMIHAIEVLMDGSADSPTGRGWTPGGRKRLAPRGHGESMPC